MMVTFVSQCEKNALKKTRRVLDAFANRIGDNTWQTVITNEGLLAVKSLLRKTASKSTAVSCFWIRSRSRSELVWIVGNRSRFDSEGTVPVNSTKKNLLNSEIENDWKYLPLIKALAALSALLHDWGKATKLFQEKLSPNSKNKFKGDPIRHEWISVLLLNALIKSGDSNNDDGWLNQLITGTINEKEIKQLTSQQTINPLYQLPPAAQLVAWLVVSHHRLPNFSNDKQRTRKTWLDEQSPTLDSVLKRIEKEWGYENKYDELEYQQRISDCFQFPKGLLSNSIEWLKQVKRWASRLNDCLPLIESAMQDGSYRLVLHHARLCLMLGDHYYSSQDKSTSWKDQTGLFANTDRQTNDYKQKLDEHLVGVAKSALDIAHLLPAFEQEPPVAQDINSLKKASPKDFRWQDLAVSKIKSWKKIQDKQSVGFFTVNMASTGCGKTFANAKVMRALSNDENSLRYILALGLRTLTLQTGDEYRDRVKLSRSELAVLIGSRAVAELHHNASHETEEITEEILGSESKQALYDEFLDYECDLPESKLTTVLQREKDRHFLYAPVLACTIDHLIAATETKRGGRYILPSLRLMSSDLVIDEIDDFTGSDLIAIGRLIHLAGMLGRKVMISSATIPPDLAEGYFNVYKKGWQVYVTSRTNANAEIGCAWIDEFISEVYTINVINSDTAVNLYRDKHNQFIDKRVVNLNKQVAKRKADIITCSLQHSDAQDKTSTKQVYYFNSIKEAILDKHQLNQSTDQPSGTKVSFGVVRVANINPCIELTKHLLQADYPVDTQIRVMAYHSQQVLLLRHEQEKHLDAVLKRKEKKGEPQKAFSDPIIRKHIEQCKTNNLIFILVATPVEEVGRDHDFDWAIVEPSSYRSIVQLAGRVRRHRVEGVDQPNVGIMQYNYKAFKQNDKKGERYFVNPGYENQATKALPFHDLRKLVNEGELLDRLDAIPRIKKLPEKGKQYLAALEHYVIKNDLADYTKKGADSMQGYLDQTWYLTALPQVLNPFRNSEKSINIFLAYNEELDVCYFTEKDEAGKPLVDNTRQIINREVMLNISHVNLSENERKNLWLERDYKLLLEKHMSEPWLTTKKRVSLRFGELNLVERENAAYEYNDQFGMVQIKNKGE